MRDRIEWEVVKNNTVDVLQRRTIMLNYDDYVMKCYIY